ncbi:hypothetical protein M011DRAFT_415704 [Sporormia fimetaria CBS 119925]|uniref:F-box domain-containing protein n=1 Tax=Sporormia fimetaria CBS 119925 TaxID=1340428 RepID=A0A6A6VRC5_9PLEO|nr:hypothetical protein M011DRAFT_415704 [Sporormia fimetaria CBS 119925]
MGSMPHTAFDYATYLPDELLLHVLDYIPRSPESQPTLASFCLVSRQWYNLAIDRLYEAPFIAGRAYDLLTRTIVPSLNEHVRKSPLASLVRVLDLSHIVHQGNKSTTARLLRRTNPSLEIFTAPQASFGVNCWAALSKCKRLRILNLSLVIEQIEIRSMMQTITQLPLLTHFYFPRCSSHYSGPSDLKPWPPHLTHLQFSGSILGVIFDLLGANEHVHPKTVTSLALSHCPGIHEFQIAQVLKRWPGDLTRLDLQHLPQIQQGMLDNVFKHARDIKNLTIAVDYISMNFGCRPSIFDRSHWRESKPLESLTLVSSGQQRWDSDEAFTPLDLFDLVDRRFFGRLRRVYVERVLGWGRDEEVGALEEALEALDRENWDLRRWHYEEFEGKYEGVSWEEWRRTSRGRRMAGGIKEIGDEYGM